MNELSDLWAHAAALGSVDAQYEYAINPRLDPMDTVVNLERWRDWRDHAPAYLDSVLHGGDARAALVLASASEQELCPIDYDSADFESSPCTAGSLLGVFFAQDPAATYRYYLLAQMLGTSADPAWLNGQLEKIGKLLSAQQIADATAQAQQTFSSIHH